MAHEWCKTQHSLGTCIGQLRSYMGKIRTWNVGIDIGLFNNRLTGSFDYFIRNTNDMVGPSEKLPATLGIAVPPSNNTDLRTAGWELELMWKDRLQTG